MSELKVKGNISDEDLTIHVLNTLAEEYDVIFLWFGKLSYVE